MSLFDAAEYPRGLSAAERDRFWRDQSAPPNVRRRKREARRWLDLLKVLSTNPSLSQRRPGDGWLTFAEMQAIWFQAHARLRFYDPELHGAVERVSWDDSVRDEGITLEEWKIRCARRWPRLKVLRAELRRFGGHPLGRDRIWAILRVPSRDDFLSTAEVAERQTR